jgi:hypothetical protein
MGVQLSFVDVCERVAPPELIRTVVKEVRVFEEVFDLPNALLGQDRGAGSKSVLAVLNEAPDRLPGLVMIWK